MTSQDAIESEVATNQTFTIQDLHALRDRSVKYGNNNEASLTITEAKIAEETKITKDLEIGQSDKVVHKSILQAFTSVTGARRSAIHFHVHPDILSNPDLVSRLQIDSIHYPKHGPVAELLPSIAPRYYQPLVFGSPGDLGVTFPYSQDDDNPQPFDHNITGAEQGGAINIATKDGITLFVGAKPLQRNLNITARLREKMGTNLDNEFQPTWRILSGSNVDQIDPNLRSFNDDGRIEASNRGVNLLADSGVAVTRLDYFSAQKEMYFVSLSWEVFDKMTQESGGLHEITFGEGLPKLIANLKKEYGIPDIPIATSLTEALTTPTFPIRRNHESVEAQNQIYKLLQTQSWKENDWESFTHIVSSLENAPEIRTGVEIRALLAKLTEQIPWPEMSKDSLKILMQNERTGEELLYAIDTKTRIENALNENIDYYSFLPDFYFDEIAAIALERYLHDPSVVVGENEYGKPTWIDSYTSRLISTVSHDKKRLEKYLTNWSSSGDTAKQDFAKWILRYRDSFNWPL